MTYSCLFSLVTPISRVTLGVETHLGQFPHLENGLMVRGSPALQPVVESQEQKDIERR